MRKGRTSCVHCEEARGHGEGTRERERTEDDVETEAARPSSCRSTPAPPNRERRKRRPRRRLALRHDDPKRTTSYKVHKGDTLDQIARVYGVTVDRLADRNRLNKDQPLRQGLVLIIPLES